MIEWAAASVGRCGNAQLRCAEALALVKECGLDALEFQAGLAIALKSAASSCLNRSIVQLPPMREWMASRRGAQPVVLRLEVEAAVEIERRAVLVELGADPRAVGERRSRPARARQERAPDAPRPGCIWDPCARSIRSAGSERPRLDRNAQDHLVLDDQAGDRSCRRRPAARRTGRAAAARSSRIVPGITDQPTAMARGFAAKR